MEKLLEDIKPEHYFITKDGQKIRNLSQLQKSLLIMKDEVFDHHTKQGRNDFSNWVRDIYKDKALADKIFSCKTKQEFSERIKESLIDAARSKKHKDVRTIIDTAKKEVEEKLQTQKKEEERIKKIEEKNVELKIEPKKVEIRQEPPKQQREEIKLLPKKEEHVFVNKPPRSFTKEEMPAKASGYQKVTAVDFVFGIIIGVIVILILKQLL